MDLVESYLKAVAQANADRVTVLGLHGKAYLASLPPLPAAPVSPPPAPVPMMTTTLSSFRSNVAMCRPPYSQLMSSKPRSM